MPPVSPRKTWRCPMTKSPIVETAAGARPANWTGQLVRSQGCRVYEADGMALRTLSLGNTRAKGEPVPAAERLEQSCRNQDGAAHWQDDLPEGLPHARAVDPLQELEERYERDSRCDNAKPAEDQGGAPAVRRAGASG